MLSIGQNKNFLSKVLAQNNTAQHMNRYSWFVVLLGVCKSQVKRKIDLVYGGANVGLMGTISQKVYNGGCRVLGYMPKTTSFVVFSTSSMFSFPSVSYIFVFYIAHFSHFFSLYMQDHSKSSHARRGICAALDSVWF